MDDTETAVNKLLLVRRDSESRHKWLCISPGMYDDLHECKWCHLKHMTQADNPDETALPEYGCAVNPCFSKTLEFGYWELPDMEEVVTWEIESKLGTDEFKGKITIHIEYTEEAPKNE